MFHGQRFKTKGINDKIPLNIQMLIWHILDNFVTNANEVDYLQIFNLHINWTKQTLQIVHQQEIPSYQMIYEFKLPIEDLLHLNNQKIYIIDNGTYNTMLLTDEY